MVKNTKHDQHCRLESCQISNVIPSSEATEVEKNVNTCVGNYFFFDETFCSSVNAIFALLRPLASLWRNTITEFLGRALILIF